MEGRALLTTDQLASKFRCPKKWIYNLVKQGMPKIEVGKGNFRFVAEDCLKWLSENQRAGS